MSKRWTLSQKLRTLILAFVLLAFGLGGAVILLAHRNRVCFRIDAQRSDGAPVRLLLCCEGTGAACHFEKMESRP